MEIETWIFIYIWFLHQWITIVFQNKFNFKDLKCNQLEKDRFYINKRENETGLTIILFNNRRKEWKLIGGIIHKGSARSSQMTKDW